MHTQITPSDGNSILAFPSLCSSFESIGRTLLAKMGYYMRLSSITVFMALCKQGNEDMGEGAYVQWNMTPVQNVPKSNF